jgi:hypothetical protein
MKTQKHPITEASHDAVAELRIGTRTCQCSVCGDFFGSPAAFDKHLRRTAHKCRSHEERTAAGMVVNPNGVWLRGTKAVEEARS